MSRQDIARPPGKGGPGPVELDDVAIAFGEGEKRFQAVSPLTLRIQPGEIVCLLGPSGCGKSTVLGALAGHLEPASGRILIDGKTVEGPDPDRGIVFQHHTLFPWLRTLENIAYGLKMKGVARDERRARARALMGSVGLAGFENYYPSQLSGGMQQRVEIARVLINDPTVLLMDEPFGALDALTRLKMHELLLALWERRRQTIVFVTHDIDEALFLADRILVMSPRPGRIIDDIRLDAARPRGEDWTTLTRFAEIRRRCLTLLRDDEAGRAAAIATAPADA